MSPPELFDIERAAREEAVDKRAKKIIGLAIQRCASDYVAEVTVTISRASRRRAEGADHRA